MTKVLPVDIEAKINSREAEYFEYKGKIYNVDDSRHGGPFDRGSADSYYGRAPKPHFFVNGTATSPKVERSAMSPEQIDEYYAGYEYNEQQGFFKEW